MGRRRYLTAAEVAKIKALSEQHGLANKVLAQRFGLGLDTVRKVLRGDYPPEGAEHG